MAQPTNDPPQTTPDPKTQAELDEIRSASEKALEGIGDIYDAIKLSPHEEMARTAGESGSRIWAGVQALGLAQGNDLRNEYSRRVNQAFRVGQIASGWTPEQIEWSEGKTDAEGEPEGDEMGSGNVSVHGDTIINVSPEITRGGGMGRQKQKQPAKPADPPPAQPQQPPAQRPPSLATRIVGPAMIAAGLTLGGWAIGSGLKAKPDPSGAVQGYSTIRLFNDKDE